MKLYTWKIISHYCVVKLYIWKIISHDYVVKLYMYMKNYMPWICGEIIHHMKNSCGESILYILWKIRSHDYMWWNYTYIYIYMKNYKPWLCTNVYYVLQLRKSERVPWSSENHPHLYVFCPPLSLAFTHCCDFLVSGTSGSEKFWGNF